MTDEVEELARLIYPDWHGHGVVPIEAREAAQSSADRQEACESRWTGM